MKKIIIPTIFVLVVITSILIVNKKSQNQAIVLENKSAATASVSSPDTPPSDQTKPATFTASFEIYTNGTKRIFTDPKYHNQSPDVYLSQQNPSIIHVNKPGITWNDFFKTLPFSVTKDCLVTGTKQTFCSSQTHKLRFFVNNIDTPGALNEEIKAGEMLKVVYGK